MSGAVDQLLARLRNEDAVLVRVESTQGSAPREAGTWMAVWADALTATIGGGQLEFQATQEARELLAGKRAIDGIQRYPLGPSLGQCCGGVMFLSYQRITAADAPAHCSANWSRNSSPWRCSAAATWAPRSHGCSPRCRSRCAGSTAATACSPTNSPRRSTPSIPSPCRTPWPRSRRAAACSS
jgi:xanthine/CO dehydrogenase XdhC/CoxF family maturation factor